MTSTQHEAQNDVTDVTMREIGIDEGREMFDRIARRTMNMSGEEFIEAWESGKFDGQPETPDLVQLVMLIPITR